MRKTFYWKNEQVSATFWEQKQKRIANNPFDKHRTDKLSLIFWDSSDEYFQFLWKFKGKYYVFQAGIILWKPFSDSYVGVFTRFSLGVRGLRVDVSYSKGIKTFWISFES